jgi:hypothetical protein
MLVCIRRVRGRTGRDRVVHFRQIDLIGVVGSAHASSSELSLLVVPEVAVILCAQGVPSAI